MRWPPVATVAAARRARPCDPAREIHELADPTVDRGVQLAASREHLWVDPAFGGGLPGAALGVLVGGGVGRNVGAITSGVHNVGQQFGWWK